MSDTRSARPRGALRALLPRPWTALSLLVAWLLLNQSLAVGHLLLGTLLALVLARIGAHPLPAVGPEGRTQLGRRIEVAVRLFGVVLRDIVVANLQVAARILGPLDELRPRFVWDPHEMRSAHGITLLAGIVTMTPGTVSAALSDDRRHLLVHGLDVADADALVAQIKVRYEAPILELFE